MKHKIKIAGIIIIGIFSLSLLINCDISSTFIDDFQAKIETDQDNVKVNPNDYYSPNVGLLKAISPGSFQRDDISTNISHVKNVFRIGEKEITRAQYQAVMGNDPSDLAVSSDAQLDPVQIVTWQEAAQFCNNLSIMEGLNPVYTNITGAVPVADWDSNGYRLPTEMEWMWTAMGQMSAEGYSSDVYLTGYAKPFSGSNATSLLGDNGTNTIDDYAFYNSNAGGTTHPVGSKFPNELGLYDMSGNVYEWNWDFYDSNGYPDGNLDSDTPEGRGAIAGSFRIIRGGSWFDNSGNCRVEGRSTNIPNTSDNRIGFRVARN